MGRASFALTNGQTYGRLIYRYRWFVLAGWALLFLVGLPLASSVPAVLTSSGYETSTSSASWVNTILASSLHQPTTQVLGVFHSAHDGRSAAA